MSKFPRKEHLIPALAILISLSMAIYALRAGPPPPAEDTIEQGVGSHFHTVEADDYWMRGVNLTDLFLNFTTWIENYTFPTPVWEETVEWGLVLGQTGDWFNHTLPGEPTAIILQMHPTNITYDDVLVYPVVYDKSATQWQLGLYWFNGTQLSAVDHPDLLVMYHMRWEPGGVDPNEPQLPEAPD